MSPKAFSEFDVNESCCFCKLRSTDVLLGPIYKYTRHKYNNRGITVHYYCMLMASHIKQNGADDQGIAGFFPKDIIAELDRGSSLRCCYCNKFGATIHCISRGCDRKFHLPCGVSKGSVHQFYKYFDSFCHLHSPKQEIPNNTMKQIKDDCIICSAQIDKKNKFSFIWPICCKPSVLLHRRCIQTMAWNAGLLLFKCPLCNNDDLFKNEMYRLGIYIPHQDASWETEPNAFQDLYVRGTGCESKNCVCPKGKSFNRSRTMWQIEQCKVCGGNGVHLGCTSKWDKRKRNYNFDWLCEICKPVFIPGKPPRSSQHSSGGTSVYDSESSNQSSPHSEQPTDNQQKENKSHTSSEHGESSSIELKTSSEPPEDEIVVIDSEDEENTPAAPQVQTREMLLWELPPREMPPRELRPREMSSRELRPLETRLKRNRAIALQGTHSSPNPEVAPQYSRLEQTSTESLNESLPTPAPKDALQESHLLLGDFQQNLKLALKERLSTQTPAGLQGSLDQTLEVGLQGSRLILQSQKAALNESLQRQALQITLPTRSPETDPPQERLTKQDAQPQKDDSDDDVQFVGVMLCKRRKVEQQTARKRVAPRVSDHNTVQRQEGSSNLESSTTLSMSDLNQSIPNNRILVPVMHNVSSQHQDGTLSSESPATRSMLNKENTNVSLSVQNMKEVHGVSHTGLAQQPSSLNISLAAQRPDDSTKAHNAGIDLPSFIGSNFPGVSINKVKCKTSEDVIHISSDEEEGQRDVQMDESSTRSGFLNLRTLLDSSPLVPLESSQHLNVSVNYNVPSTSESADSIKPTFNLQKSINGSETSHSKREEIMCCVILSDDEDEEVPSGGDIAPFKPNSSDQHKDDGSGFLDSSLNCGIGSIISVVSLADQAIPFSFPEETADDCIDKMDQDPVESEAQEDIMAVTLDPNSNLNSPTIQNRCKKRKSDIASSSTNLDRVSSTDPSDLADVHCQY